VPEVSCCINCITFDTSDDSKFTCSIPLSEPHRREFKLKF
jgi:hypothetical protein